MRSLVSHNIARLPLKRLLLSSFQRIAEKRRAVIPISHSWPAPRPYHSEASPKTRSRPWISTLDPARIKPSDFCVLSDRTIVSPFGGEGGLRVVYYVSTGKAPFPPQTHGFFYYARPPPGARPDELGEIRFRVTKDADPASFAAGHDLLSPEGMPWRIGAGRVARPTDSGLHGTVLGILLKDGIVTEEMLDLLEKRAVGKVVYSSKCTIAALGRPFPVNMESRFWRVRVVVGPDLRPAVLLNPFQMRSPGGAFFRGRLLVCFERSPLPQHANSRWLVLRALKIIKPLEPLVPLPEKRAMDTPKEGALFTRHGRPHLLDVNKDTVNNRALRLLFSDSEEAAAAVQAAKPSARDGKVS